jgi:hypothetical protein
MNNVLILYGQFFALGRVNLIAPVAEAATKIAPPEVVMALSPTNAGMMMSMSMMIARMQIPTCKSNNHPRDYQCWTPDEDGAY